MHILDYFIHKLEVENPNEITTLYNKLCSDDSLENFGHGDHTENRIYHFKDSMPRERIERKLVENSLTAVMFDDIFPHLGVTTVKMWDQIEDYHRPEERFVNEDLLNAGFHHLLIIRDYGQKRIPLIYDKELAINNDNHRLIWFNFTAPKPYPLRYQSVLDVKLKE